MIYKTNSGYGVNFNQICPNNKTTGVGYTRTSTSITITDNTITIGTGFNDYRCDIGVSTITGHKYYLRINSDLSTLRVINYYSGAIISSDTIFTEVYGWYLRLGFVQGTALGTYTLSITVFDLTQMFGAGNEPTTVAEFREMYPDDYYDYTLSQWQWSKKGKITSYPTPVIENGTTLLPIENHIVGLAHYNDGNTDIIYNYAKRELPAGFLRLDYIESTGNQYIDTGYKITATTDITIRFINDDTGSLPTTPFGVVGDNNIGYVSTWAYWRIYDTVGYYPSGGHFTGNHEFKVIGNKLYVDGVDSGYTGGTPQNIYTYNLYLFGRNNNGTLANSKGCVIYYCKIYDNGVLARNFIPCYRYSDGIEGLYDTVGKQFYTNQGTGRFIRGKEIDSGNLLELKNFVRGYPSDTGFENTRKRIFTENTYVVGLAANNYYIPSNVTSFNVDGEANTVTITGGNGYGVLFVTPLKRNTTYKFYSYYSGSGFNPVSTYYASDGTFLGSIYHGSSGNITTPDYDFAYALIGFTSATTSATATFSAISLHEVYN